MPAVWRLAPAPHLKSARRRSIPVAMLPPALKSLLTTPSRKFAVLVVLGMSMVALPMAEMWRRLGLELRATSAAQSGLTPLVLSVQTQHALAAHRPYAAAVLSGRLDQEGERARRQREVDLRLAALGGALETRLLHRALDEADQLRIGWSTLLQGIGQRRLPLAACDTSHQLLIEQTYVIADLVAAATGLHGQAGRAFGTAEAALALVALPRYAAALSAFAASADDAAAGVDLAAAHSGALRAAARRLAQAAADVLAQAGASDEAAASAGAVPADAADRALSPDLLAALMSLQQSATAVARDAAPQAMGAVGHAKAEQAAFSAASTLIHHLDDRLVLAQDTLRLERARAAAAGLLAAWVAALAAALALPRAQSESDNEPPAQPHHADTDADVEDTLPLHATLGSQGAESEQPTSELLQRLRRSEVNTAADIDIDIGVRPHAQPDPPAG